MLKASIAFVTLLSGFLFVTKWHESRYIIRRQDSQGVYFYAAAAGIALLVVSIGLYHFLDGSLLSLRKVIAVWTDSKLPLDDNVQSTAATYWIMVLTLTLALGLVGGHILNFCQAVLTMQKQDWVVLLGDGIKGGGWWNPVYYIKGIYGYSSFKPLGRAIDRLNADFELILHRAFEQAKPVCFTLKSGKVYVGQVMGAVDPVDSRDMIRILPTVSGYRDPETHKIRFTTFYKKLYGDISAKEGLRHLHDENFEIVFRFEEVQTANLFDMQAYDEFQQHGATGGGDKQLEMELNNTSHHSS